MSTQSLVGDIKRRTVWSTVMGVATVILGLFLIAYPLAAAAITTVLLGWVLIFVGITQFVFALHSHSVGNFVLKIILCLLYLLAGISLAFFPLAGVATLTVLLGVFLLVVAGVELVTAFQFRPSDGWGWYLFDSAASLLMAILILAGWPSSAIWAIGTLVGVAVLVSGISRVMLATKIRSTVTDIDEFRRAA